MAAKRDLVGDGAGYIRVSTEQQDGERQRDAITRFLKRHNLTITAANWFVDEGWKRWQADIRPAFNAMLQGADAGRIKWIVVDRQDRAEAADKFEFIANLHRLRKAGCALITCDDEVLTENDLGRFIKTGLESEKSESELKEKSVRVLEGRMRKAKLGVWLGGPIPYGLDVVCFDLDMVEQWRVRIDGHNQRVQIHPSGKAKRYDGRKNFPPSSSQEFMQLRPGDAERIKFVQQIFKWYLNEASTFSSIAERLNRLGVKHSYSLLWKHHHVREILRNPVYTGRIPHNRKSGGRFMEFVDGGRREVDTQKVNPNSNRPRAENDWVWSDEIFESIISVEAWRKVQEKIGAVKEYGRRAPRAADLWLAGLVYCEKCGKRMRGSKHKPQPNHRSPNVRLEYICSTYADNPKGAVCSCQRNAVSQGVLEKFVVAYLEEIGAALGTPDQMSEAQPPAKALEALRRQTKATFRIWDRLGIKRLGLVQLEEMELLDYGKLFDSEKPALEKRLAKVDAEHTAITNRLLSLPPRAKAAVEKTQKMLMKLETELEDIKGKLADASQEYMEATQDLQTAMQEFAAAKDAVNGDAAARTKAEAVRRVIGKIFCHFSSTGKRHPTSELMAVSFLPAGEEDAVLPQKTGDDGKCPNGGADIRSSPARG